MRSRFDTGLRFSFFLIEITGQKFSTRVKNGSDRLRKGQLHLLPPFTVFSFLL